MARVPDTFSARTGPTSPVVAQPVPAPRARGLPTPPMVRGLPLVGSLLEFRRDHVGIFERAYREHGPVFSIRLGPQRGVVLIGPEYHGFFFGEVDRRLSVPELYRFVVPMFGEVVMAVRDLETRRRHVGLMQSAFQGRRLERYARTMVTETCAWLDGLGDGTLELWDELETLSMSIAAATLMGPEVRGRIGAFRPLLSDLARGMEFVLPPNLPLPRFRRRDRAREALVEMIRPILAERRARPAGSEDFIQVLADDPSLRNGDGGDELLVGMALCTIFTGYITTAAQMAWTLVLLLQHPDYLERVVAELDEQRAGLSTFPAHARLPRLDRAVKEAVRLRPVMSHYARTNAEEYELDGFRMPKGWLTMLCPPVAHRLPHVFADPDRYDPDRFGPARAEDRQPNALIGFSGGFYRCPGSGFGTAEIKVALGLLLEQFAVELVDSDPPAAFDLGVMRPASPCRIRVERRR
jgi:sterol 14alpha-demethylase